MKKFLSISITIIILALSLNPLYCTFNDKTNIKNVEKFCSELIDMAKKYDNDIYNTFSDEDGNKSIGNTSNRLIVKTMDKIDFTSAIDCVYGLEYAVLQYKSKGDMLEAYDILEKRGYTVDKDMVLNFFDSKKNQTDTAKNDNSDPITYTDAGNISNDNEIVVGIMDTGIDYNHSEFAGRYVHNPVNFGTSGEADDPMDDNMHGTACASIVTQHTPENIKVKPYKILNSNGSTTEINVLLACEYILAENDKPDVVNMSFGGYGKGEKINLIYDVINRLIDNGITICVAAGNDSLPTNYFYPASLESVITVASCNDYNQFSDYSNYGDAIDITATGEEIRTAELGGGYNSKNSGTSFSAPFVSAASAMLLAQNPDLSPAEIKDKIKSTAINMGPDDEFYYGAGVLSFDNLLNNNSISTPMPSVPGGTYHEEQTISFDNIAYGQLIYTTDRTTPTERNGTVYSDPFTIDCDTQLTFALMSGSEYISPIVSQNYVIQYYAPSSDFTAVAGTIMKYKGDKTNIIVPDKISGLKVTGVYRELFKNSKLTGIVLPDTVTVLGTGCFQGSTSLKHIVAEGVTKLNGDSVFEGCTDLRDEVMPELKTVTALAFKDCAKLHHIDFGENITELKNELFSGAGLFEADFPNAKENSATEVFRSCPIFTCNIPNYTKLNTKFFYACKILDELNIGKVTQISDSALYSCSMLKQIDTSEIITLEDNSLSGCCIEKLYAPKCKSLPAKFGKYCYIRVIDLPNAVGTLESNAFNCSETEEIYLDKVSDMSKSAFRNMTKLNIVYLPNCANYYEPYTNVELIDSIIYPDQWNQKSPLEILWVPNANLPSEINCYSTKLIYAPNAESININMQSEDIIPSIVLSDKVNESSITVKSIDNKPVIIAPKNSYAHIYSADNECGYTYVNTDDVLYKQLDERSFFTYQAESSEFCVPKEFISEYWCNDIINKSRDEIIYAFLLDFSNDKVLNAKDYSILIKNK